MKTTHCKLSKKVQLKLLEFFIAKVTARTAADLLGIQASPAILYYHKIRLVKGSEDEAMKKFGYDVSE